jgi:hypothetical protein
LFGFVVVVLLVAQCAVCDALSIIELK